ncbi:hypothetical protein RI129_010807 [Pyrocoelia pectoralis]|uniref:SCP domain-containing protein n=1 Tax=Pyrocoelia pectoralis TaxID=417401 RepID=A0AAN7ZGT1_9COLE
MSAKIIYRQFDNEVLVAHNNYRARHGVPPLVLNPTISKFSQSWAEYLSTQTNVTHSGKYGENIYRAWSLPSNFELKGNVPVDRWYAEIANYTFNQEPTKKGTGHFTQLIWKDSKEIGVGKVKVWVVVNYSSPGNYPGQYVANVPPPRT